MAVNFCPNREQMIKEVERCVASAKLDVLLTFCKSCVYNIFVESKLVAQCLKCSIQQGMMKISNAKKLTTEPDTEFLGVC